MYSTNKHPRPCFVLRLWVVVQTIVALTGALWSFWHGDVVGAALGITLAAFTRESVRAPLWHAARMTLHAADRVLSSLSVLVAMAYVAIFDLTEIDACAHLFRDCTARAHALVVERTHYILALMRLRFHGPHLALLSRTTPSPRASIPARCD